MQTLESGPPARLDAPLRLAGSGLYPSSIMKLQNTYRALPELCHLEYVWPVGHK